MGLRKAAMTPERLAGEKPRVRCAACNGRLRVKLGKDDRYDPPWYWVLPPRCGHCGVEAQPGSGSITVIPDEE